MSWGREKNGYDFFGFISHFNHSVTAKTLVINKVVPLAVKSSGTVTPLMGSPF